MSTGQTGNNFHEFKKFLLSADISRTKNYNYN